MHTGLFTLLTCQPTKCNCSHSGVNVRAHLLRQAEQQQKTTDNKKLWKLAHNNIKFTQKNYIKKNPAFYDNNIKLEFREAEVSPSETEVKQWQICRIYILGNME